MRIVRSLSSFPLVALLTASAALAQAKPSEAQPGVQPDVTILAGPSIYVQNGAAERCPVGLSATRQGRAMEWRAIDYIQPDGVVPPSMERDENGARTPPTGQGLELTLRGPNARRIVEATVVVHGWTGAGQMLLDASTPDTAERPQGRKEAEKSFHLQSGPGDPGLTHARLWTTGSTAVNWVQVTEMTYADGTEWRSGRDQHCRATPSPLVLVASGR